MTDVLVAHVLNALTFAVFVALVGFLFGFGLLGAVDAWDWDVLVHWLQRRGWRSRS